LFALVLNAIDADENPVQYLPHLREQLELPPAPTQLFFEQTVNDPSAWSASSHSDYDEHWSDDYKEIWLSLLKPNRSRRAFVFLQGLSRKGDDPSHIIKKQFEDCVTKNILLINLAQFIRTL
jgi:hypothetical protein